jgi:cysteine-rich repeat protein
MSHTHSSIRRPALLGILFFSLLSVACLEQTAMFQGTDTGAHILPLTRFAVFSSSRKARSSSSKSSSRFVIKKSSASSSLHAAALTLSPRRHSTGALVIIRASSAPTVAIKAGCGDGLMTGSEECDDGNTINGDGCSHACTVETGYACSSGQPSKCWSSCGDGILASNEKCDDGNNLSGDGCSATCKVEFGFQCSESPSVCAVPAYCGNGVIEKGEDCDDGNNHSGDGCYHCKFE